MKLTNRSEYALLALVYLARQKQGDYVGGAEIAKAQNIPPKFLQQILLILKRARYIQSCKGQQGGYRLAKPAAEISIAEIVRLLDGALAPTESVSRCFYEPTPLEKEKKLIEMFSRIRDAIAETMENTTIADVK
jgi:Rrf2 family transcriptional regulator, cysteine metabolism repressor